MSQNADIPPFDPAAVEESDVGICADGWDNFLFDDETEELTEYLAALRVLNAPKCAKVLQELLELISATKPARPIELTDTHKAELTALWRRYDSASHEENPQALARKRVAKKNRLPITDREFYDFLGQEDGTKPCQHEDCNRGSVRFSVLCRVHHFESIKRKPCPWNE